ncbi:unnamed protein product, partial [Amoebophrya sp. A25]
ERPETLDDIDSFPLLGVPISVKDQFRQKGCRISFGGVGRFLLDHEEEDRTLTTRILPMRKTLQ